MVTAIDETRPVRWGILSAGWIAEQFAADITATDGNEMVAVAARDADRAADFARRHGIARSYGGYDGLFADDDVDVIYIASTHPFHLQHAMAAIAAGRSILIEKPVTLTSADTQTVLDAARASDVFAMEGMWTRLNPLIRQAQQLIAEGTIGTVRSVRASFGLGLPFDPAHRLYDLNNGGGALLDLGIYPVTFGWLFLGRPDAVTVTGDLSPTGTDATVAMQWSFTDGRDAQLWCSAPLAGPNDGIIIGTEGYLVAQAPFHRPAGLLVHTATGEEHHLDPLPAGSFGYGPEIAEVARCLRAGLNTSPLVPHAETIAIMGLLDEARAALGVRYPGE